jgi:hypothetical protein
MRAAFLSPTKGTNNTFVNEGKKGFCQQTLTKLAFGWSRKFDQTQLRWENSRNKNKLS